MEWAQKKGFELEDVRSEHVGHDFVMNGRKIEIKTMQSANRVAIEEANKAIDGRNDERLGWIYTTSADYICWVNCVRMYWAKTKDLQKWWNENRERYALIKNRPSVQGSKRWQGEFRYCPTSDIPEEFTAWTLL